MARFFKVLFLLGIASSFLSFNQKSEFKFYLSLTDYLNDAPLYDVKPKEIEEFGHYIRIKKFYPSYETKKDPAAKHPWAVEHRGVTYFNLWYSLDFDAKDLYIKGTRTGRMLYFILDKATIKEFKDHMPVKKGLGNSDIIFTALNGAVEAEEKGCSKWRSEDEEKKRLLINNTARLDMKKAGRMTSLWKYLNCGRFNDILGTDYPKKDIKSFSFEEVVEMVNKKGLEITD